MIELKSNNDDGFEKLISTNLHIYNRSKCEWIRDNTEIRPLKKHYNFAVYEDDKLIGGAVGMI